MLLRSIWAQREFSRPRVQQISTRVKTGHSSERGQLFHPQSVRAMIEKPQPRRRRPTDAID